MGATVLGGALSLLFIFLLIGLKAFAVGNQDDRGGKYTQADRYADGVTVVV